MTLKARLAAAQGAGSGTHFSEQSFQFGPLSSQSSSITKSRAHHHMKTATSAATTATASATQLPQRKALTCRSILCDGSAIAPQSLYYLATAAGRPTYRTTPP